jgi:DNA primase
VYIKSKILYGIYQAKNDIRKQDECLLVEGYTDVISLVQAGIENVVASSGTALTTDQIKLVKRLTKNITVLYDGDWAGIKAAIRGTDMILEEGMNVRIVVLPDQEDPDSYVRRLGATEFTKYVKENRKDIILFKTSLFADEAKNDPIKKTELIRDIMQTISKIPDPIQRSVYIKQCAQQMEMSEQLLITEVNKTRRQKSKEEYKEDIAPQTEAHDLSANKEVHAGQIAKSPQDWIQYLERDIVRILMEYGAWEIYIDKDHTESAAQFILEDLEGITFESRYKYTYEFIKQHYAEGKIFHPNEFTLHEDPEVSSVAISLLTSSHELSENWWKKYEVAVPDKAAIYRRDIHSATMRFKQFKNMQELKKVEEQIKASQNEEETQKLLYKYKVLTDLKREYTAETGTVIFKPF